MYRLLTILSLCSLIAFLIASGNRVANASDQRAVDLDRISVPVIYAKATGNIVPLKSTPTTKPNYPAGFWQWWGNEEPALREFEIGLEKLLGFQLNGAQKYYVRSVIQPEVRAVGYSVYQKYGSDGVSLGREVYQYAKRNAERWVAALLDRADEEQLADLQAASPPPPAPAGE
jgi:hypothetical protein